MARRSRDYRRLRHQNNPELDPELDRLQCWGASAHGLQGERACRWESRLQAAGRQYPLNAGLQTYDRVLLVSFQTGS